MTYNYYRTDSAWAIWSSTATDSVWSNWNNYTATSTSYTTNDGIWYSWSTQTDKSSNAVHALTKEQLKEFERLATERQRIAEEQQRRYEEMERKKNEAEEKAKQLLMDLIGPEQLKVYEETGRLLVRGRSHDYLVNKVGMIQQIEKDKLVDFCVHLESRYSYPNTDNVVALKLLLENDEESVIKLANKKSSYPKPEQLRAACM